MCRAESKEPRLNGQRFSHPASTFYQDYRQFVVDLVCGAGLKGVGGFSLVCVNDGSRFLTVLLIWTA